MSRYHYPPKSSSQQSLFLRKKHQLGVSRMGILVQRYIKYLKCHSFSENFFREKNKKDRCGGTQEREQMFENKERAEKQLLTVNSVNPSCSSALKIYSITFPLKENYFSIHSQAGIICTVFPSTVSSSFSFSVIM